PRPGARRPAAPPRLRPPAGRRRPRAPAARPPRLRRRPHGRGRRALPEGGAVSAYVMKLERQVAELQRRVAELERAGTFQARVQPWMLECFGAQIAGDRMERNNRFFEE